MSPFYKVTKLKLELSKFVLNPTLNDIPNRLAVFNSSL